jgi:hypothetical protein
LKSDLFHSVVICIKFVPFNYFPNGTILEILVFAQMNKKIPYFYKPGVHYRIHLDLLLTTKQNHFNMQPISRASILILANPLRIGFRSGLITSDFQTNIFMCFTSLSVCSVHLVLLGVISSVTFPVEYKLWIPSLRNFSPVFYSFHSFTATFFTLTANLFHSVRVTPISTKK